MMRKRKRNGKVTSLAQDLKPILRQISKGQKDVHPEIWARWGDILGFDLARRAIPRSLVGGILTVAVASSSWMQELSYLKPALLDRFREEIGITVVKDIRLTLDASLAGVLKDPKEKKQQPNKKAGTLPPEIEAAASTVRDETLRKTIERAAKANLVKKS